MTSAFRGGAKNPNREYVRESRDMMLELLVKPLTQKQLARLCQRHYETIRRVLRKMHQERLVHITDWQVHDVGPHEAVFALGDEPDAPNPGQLPHAVRCERWRARRRPPRLRDSDPLLAAMMGV